jgi:hypothetical protein
MKCSGPCGKQYPYTEIVGKVGTRRGDYVCVNCFLLDRGIPQATKDEWIAAGKPHMLPPEKKLSKYPKGQGRLFD